jgi:hypothetical protein
MYRSRQLPSNLSEDLGPDHIDLAIDRMVESTISSDLIGIQARTIDNE